MEYPGSLSLPLISSICTLPKLFHPVPRVQIYTLMSLKSIAPACTALLNFRNHIIYTTPYSTLPLEKSNRPLNLNKMQIGLQSFTYISVPGQPISFWVNTQFLRLKTKGRTLLDFSFSFRFQVYPSVSPVISPKINFQRYFYPWNVSNLFPLDFKILVQGTIVSHLDYWNSPLICLPISTYFPMQLIFFIIPPIIFWKLWHFTG